MVTRKLICLVLCLVFLAFSAGDKKDAKKWYQEKRIAFLVGINHYEATTSLKYAVDDVNQLEKLFLQVGHFSKIVKLTDQGKFVTTRDPKTGAYASPLPSTPLRERRERPTKENIKNTYKELIAENPDLLVFYFSGHGFISGDQKGENSIAPMDVELIPGTRQAKNGISLLELSNTNDKINLVYLIDACRSPLPKVRQSTKFPPTPVNGGANHTPSTKNVDTKDSKDECRNKACLVPTTPNLKSAFVDTMDELSLEIENAEGVVMLLGAAPGGSALEDKDLESGAFSFFLRKAISGGIHDERAEEFVTVDSLKEYIEAQFELYHKEEPRRPKQKLYHLSNNRGFKGDFLLTYGRPPESKVEVEKNLYYDSNELRNVQSKLTYDKEGNRSLLRFFAKNKKTGDYYPESLEGIASMKYKFYKNQESSTDFYALEYNLEGEKVFEHKMEFLPDSGWEYKGIYKQTEEDKKDKERQNIYFEKKIYDFMGNVLFQEYYDRQGNAITIAGVKTVQRSYDFHGQKILEEFLDEDDKLIAPKRQNYARYAAVYVSKGNLLSEAWYGADGKFIENKDGVARIDYAYDRDWKLSTIENWDKNGKPTGDKTGVAKTVFSYNDSCLKTKRERLLKNVDYKKKRRVQEAWVLGGYKACIESVIHTDKEKKPASDAKHIHKKQFTFDDKGNKVIEEYFRPDGRRWARYGVTKKEHEYDKDGNITKTSNFGIYEVDGKPVPTIDEFGVHAYTYSYDFNHRDCLTTRQKQGVLYREYDCADTIQHLGIDCKPIENTEGVAKVRVWYDGTGQEKALREYYGMENRYVKSTRIGLIHIFDSKFNQTLYAKFTDKDGKLNWKNTYKYDEYGNKTLEEKYIINGGKEALDWKKVYKYDTMGNKTLEARFISNDGKETLDFKITSKYDTVRNLTLYAKYILKDEKETLHEKKVYEYDENGNKTLNALYKLKDGKETLDYKIVSKYDTMGNLTLYTKYIDKNGKETLDFKHIKKYDEQNNLTAIDIYNLKMGKEVLNEKRIFQYNEKGNNTLYIKYSVKDAKETLEEKKVYKYDTKGNKIFDANYIGKDGKERLIHKYINDYDDKGNKTLYSAYNIIDGKEILDFKYEYEYDENGNKTLDALYKLKDGKETLDKKYVYKYDERGNKVFDAYYKLIDGKETLVPYYGKKVYKYDENGNKIYDAKYTNKDGLETLLFKSVYEYDENGNKTFEAKYNDKEGQDTLIFKSVYEYDTMGNKIFHTYHINKGGQESLYRKYIYKYHNDLKEIKEYYTKFFDTITKELDPKAKINPKDEIWDKETKANKLAKKLKDTKALKKIDDAWNEYKAKNKKYTLIYENFNKEGTFKEQEYKLLFDNPRGSYEDRLIRVELDRFYRPVEVVFESKE